MNKLLYLFLTSPASSKRVTFDEGNFIATDALDNDCDGFVLEDLVQCGLQCEENHDMCVADSPMFNIVSRSSCVEQYGICINKCPCIHTKEHPNAEFTKLSAGECTGEWSSWNDRDNPSGTGDWELVHLRADYKDLCKAPIAAEGRIVSTGAVMTTEVVDFTVNGLICKNSDQHDKSCLDYEVRFCCLEEISLEIGECNGTWSSWDDRDDPSATGDWELLHLRHDAKELCTDPTAVQARVVGTTQMTTTQNVALSLTGLSCQNDNQPQDEGCWDYEVRFCCENKVTEMTIGECENGEWTAWDDRDDPSATGDWEPLYLGTASEICDFPIAAEARIIGSNDLLTTQNVQLTLEGFVCQNRHQPLGEMCLDYEVRYCCGPNEDETLLHVGPEECPGSWSSWDDRDNGSGTGDWEMLDLRADADDLCSNPVAVQGRIVGTTDMLTTQNVQINLSGVYCQNSLNPGDRCLDYEARFCCPETTSLDIGECDKFKAQWSSWHDRDDPTATGDWELLHLRPDAHHLCKEPLAVQARVVGTNNLDTTQVVSFSNTGFSCLNAANTEMCFDYEVRFCCPIENEPFEPFEPMEASEGF